MLTEYFRLTCYSIFAFILYYGAIQIPRNRDEFMDKLSETGVNVVWGMTKIYVVVSKYTANIYMGISRYYNMHDDILEERNVEMINKKVLYAYNWNNMLPGDIDTIPQMVFDDTKMVLFKWKTIENSETNMEWKHYVLRFSSIQEINDNFTFSNIKFLSIEIKLNDKDIFAVDFKKENYYIKSNILLDKTFCEYWLHEKYNIELEDTDSYIVSFIDHKMNYITVKEDEGVFIDVNDYTIIKSQPLSAESEEDVDEEEFVHARSIENAKNEPNIVQKILFSLRGADKND